MALDETTFFRRRSDILSEMLGEGQAAIPDLYVGQDGNLAIVFTIQSGQLENVFLGNQLLAEDIFIHTASLVALKLYGNDYDLPIHVGSRASGSLLFEGAGGTYIPIGAEVAYDPGTGLDVVYFNTTQDGTIPNTGIPDPPSVVVNVASGNLNGTYEYVVTFVTAAGETLPSDESVTVNPATQKADLSAIPLGGAGTTKRRIYRRKNGAGDFRRVVELADNTTTTYTDNIADATVNAAALVPSVDTAHRISLTAQAQDPGSQGSVAIGTITALTDAPAELTSVTNPAVFSGGTDQEDTEVYRQRLLTRVRSPQTGAPLDIKSWAESVDGVESATVFPNVNVTTSAPGHVTVRIAGPNGTLPDSGVQAAVLAVLQEKGLAQITYHVTTFTAVPKNVDVTITLQPTFVLGDVSGAVALAITNYINSLAVGATLRISGIVDAVFGLSGVADVVVTTPSTNQTAAATEKITPGTITVS